MTAPDPRSVGSVLWWVPTRGYGAPQEVVITKVGRKWLSLSNGHRVDREDMIADGGAYNSPGRCYHSRGEHEAVIKLSAAWHSLRMRMQNTPLVPDGVGINQIENARRALFKESK